MKFENISIQYQLFDSIAELTPIKGDLMERSRLIMLQSYAPYSKFNVGAALLLEDGNIVTGNNQENASYPCGLCAERTAIFYANAQFPNLPVMSMAICVSHYVSEYPVAPCGICRQVILETETRFNQPIEILLLNKHQQVFVFHSIKDLLPFSFDSSFLNS